jgi:hypothetical protein
LTARQNVTVRQICAKRSHMNPDEQLDPVVAWAVRSVTRRRWYIFTPFCIVILLILKSHNRKRRAHTSGVTEVTAKDNAQD